MQTWKEKFPYLQNHKTHFTYTSTHTSRFSSGSDGYNLRPVLQRQTYMKHHKRQITSTSAIHSTYKRRAQLTEISGTFLPPSFPCLSNSFARGFGLTTPHATASRRKMDAKKNTHTHHVNKPKIWRRNVVIYPPSLVSRRRRQRNLNE